MLDLAQFPPIWQAALADIAACRSGLIVGVACLPGGEPTAQGLIDLGMVERVAARPHQVTLTPWGAEALGVEPYEWGEESEPVWMLRSRIEEDESIGERAFVSRGVPKHVRGETDRRVEALREWYTDGDGEPVKTLTTKGRARRARAERLAALERAG